MTGTAPENKRIRLAEGLARGWTLHRAAKSAKVPYSTARRIASEPEFKALVRSLLEHDNSRALAVYTRGRVKAALAQMKLLADPDPDVRQRAVSAVNRDLLAMEERMNPAGSPDRPAAPGIVVPGADNRWDGGRE